MSLPDQQIEEARAELAMFGAQMGKPAPLPSRGPPSSAESLEETPNPELGAMDVDASREKRVQFQEETAQTPPTKFAKGDNKGDHKQDVQPPNGKGRPSHSTVPEQGGAKKDSERRPERSSGNQAVQQQGRSNWGRGQWSRQSWSGRQQQDSDREARLKEMVRCLARLCLRMEDALAVASLDCEFILFLQTKTGNPVTSITDDLYNTALDWKARKEADPTSLSQPMRNVLLFCLLTCLQRRLQELETDEPKFQQAKEKGLIEDKNYLYLQWSPEQKRHIKATQEPISHEETVQAVAAMLKLIIFPSVVGRFHALRQLGPNMASDVISFCPHPPDAQPRESTDARLHESSLALQLLAPHRCDGPPGEVGALPSGNPDREDAPIALSPQPGSVLGTSLHNASNHCYPNASILSIAWSAAQLPAGLLIHHRPMGRFLQWLFRWPQGSSLHLWHVRAWRRLVSTWQDPHAQHDCAEFLQHLRSAFCPEGEFLQWQARTLPHSHARAEVSDQGHLWPLTIPVALQLAAYTQNRLREYECRRLH